jgi:hypothetical protein
LKAWLRKQPRAISVAFAARAALRVVPVLETAKPDERYMRDLVLPSFRATAVSWAAARYPARETELSAGAATAAFWSAVSNDATHVEEGAAASVIAGSPLWPQGHRTGSGLCGRK